MSKPKPIVLASNLLVGHMYKIKNKSKGLCFWVHRTACPSGYKQFHTYETVFNNLMFLGYEDLTIDFQTDTFAKFYFDVRDIKIIYITISELTRVKNIYRLLRYEI